VKPVDAIDRCFLVYHKPKKMIHRACNLLAVMPDMQNNGIRLISLLLINCSIK